MRNIQSINEFWGAVIRRDMSSAVREEDKFHNYEELKEYLKKEIEKQGKHVVIKNLDVSGIDGFYKLFNQILPSTVESLDLSGWNLSGVKDIKAMFWNCKNLKSLDLSGWNTSGVKDMSFVFSNCSKIKALDVTGWKTDSVKNMRHMFNSCFDLEELDLSGWKTDNVEDMDNMFFNCTNLKSLNLSGWNVSNVCYMEYMFAYCKKLESLDLTGWELKSDWWSVKGMVDTSYMFDNCPAPYKVVDNEIVRE